MSNSEGHGQPNEPGYRQPPYHVPPQPPQPPDQESGLSLVGGLVLPFPLLLVQIPLCYFLPVILPLVGLTQAIYIVPLVLVFRRAGRKKLALGLIISASLIFILNATCLGLLFGIAGLSSLH